MIQTNRGNNYFTDIPEARRSQDRGERRMGMVGFRIVHEAGHYAGIADGNLWYSLGEFARPMYRQFHLPGGQAETVGIRLVWDREEG
jgi:hypothetical protein